MSSLHNPLQTDDAPPIPPLPRRGRRPRGPDPMTPTVDELRRVLVSTVRVLLIPDTWHQSPALIHALDRVKAVLSRRQREELTRWLAGERR